MNYEEENGHLNEDQKKAVLDESCAAVVNANVGSGKTTVLISKILYLHEAKQVDYRDMAVLTFTNKAADEIKERLCAADSSVKQEELWGFGTFHSVALYLLKKLLPVETLGYTKEFRVIDPDEETDLAQILIKSRNLSIKYKNRLKKRLAQRDAKYQDDLLLLADLLKEEKIKQNKMAFSELIENCCSLLRREPLELKWVILDEVQDCDSLQLEMIDSLMGPATRLFAVGDPNQVIYSWRGSAFQVFYKLKKKYGATELSLPINYRSGSSILEAARCFLQSGPPLTGVRQSGSRVTVKKQYDEFNEACYLADRIGELHKKGVPYGEIAVFYRLQEQSEILEKVFTEQGLPYEVSLKKTVQDIPALNWAMNVFRYSANRKDLPACHSALCHKQYGERLSSKEADRVVREMDEVKSGLLKRMNELEAASRTIADAESLYAYFDFDRYLRPTSSTFLEDKKAVLQLAGILLSYAAENGLEFLDGMREFINSSALYGINILKKDLRDDADCVKLMTLHASKGLEFSHVFIIGVNYGLIPLGTKNFDAEEEERRLFFVGITRAKDELELSYYTNPGYFKAVPGKSRYLNMIPARVLEEEGAEENGVNLRDLKRQIQEMKLEKNAGEREKTEDFEKTKDLEKNESPEKSVPGPPDRPDMSPARKVRHNKYGVGTVLSDDGMMIEVEFENYGVKEFMKGFCEMEELTEP